MNETADSMMNVAEFGFWLLVVVPAKGQGHVPLDDLGGDTDGWRSSGVANETEVVNTCENLDRPFESIKGTMKTNVHRNSVTLLVDIVLNIGGDTAEKLEGSCDSASL